MKKFRCLPLLPLLLCASCAHPGSRVRIAPHEGPDRPGLVYFAQITDTHQGPGIHQWRFDRAIEAVNRSPLPLACVLHTGDFSSGGIHKPETAAAIAERLHRIEAPLLTVPGNHDIVAKWPGTTRAAAKNFQENFGGLGQRFETNGVVFLALYTEPLRGGRPIDLGVEYDPIEWLRRELRASGGKPVIVATHTPANADFYAGGPQPGWPDAERERWVNALAEGNVVAVVCGHFHRDEVHWDERGVPTYVASSIAGFWGRQGSYRIYEYDPATRRLGYRTLYFEDPAPARESPADSKTN